MTQTLTVPEIRTALIQNIADLNENATLRDCRKTNF